jgi:hypothetical protein
MTRGHPAGFKMLFRWTFDTSRFATIWRNRPTGALSEMRNQSAGAHQAEEFVTNPANFLCNN